MKFPHFWSKLLREAEKSEERGEKCVEKGEKCVEKGENHSDPIYTNPMKNLPSKIPSRFYYFKPSFWSLGVCLPASLLSHPSVTIIRSGKTDPVLFCKSLSKPLLNLTGSVSFLHSEIPLDRKSLHYITLSSRINYQRGQNYYKKTLYKNIF